MSDKKDSLKIIVLGDSGVGKTALISRFIDHQFTERFIPSIGATNKSKEVVIDDRTIELQIYDIAGEERFQSLGYYLYSGSDACVLVFDITNQSSFQRIDDLKRNFLLHTNAKNADKFPFLLFGNKVDKPTEQRTVTADTAQLWAKANGIADYFETSAKEDVNVEQAFITVAKIVLHQKEKEKIQENNKSKENCEYRELPSDKRDDEKERKNGEKELQDEIDKLKSEVNCLKNDKLEIFSQKNVCLSLSSRIINEKPLLASKINSLINNLKDDFNENALVLNELSNTYILCKTEIKTNISVWVIDDDNNGQVIEVLPNEEYMIRLNNGNVIKKNKKQILPNSLN